MNSFISIPSIWVSHNISGFSSCCHFFYWLQIAPLYNSFSDWIIIFFRKKKCSNQIVLPLLIFSTISKLHSLFKLAIRTIPKVKNWYEMNLWCWNSIQDIHALYDFFSGWIKIKIQSIFDKIQTLIRRIWIEKL